jgi:hypothetical protein
MMQGDDPDHHAKIKVFLEDPAWDAVEKHWQLSDADIRRLYVESWECQDECVSLADAEFVRKQYEFPVCLVYIGAPVGEAHADGPNNSHARTTHNGT